MKPGSTDTEYAGDEWIVVEQIDSIAGKLGDSARQSTAHRSGLRKARALALMGSSFLGISSFLKTQSFEEYPSVLHELHAEVASKDATHTNNDGAASTLKSLSERLLSDPESRLSKMAIEKVTENLSRRYASFDELPPSSENPRNHQAPNQLEEYSGFTTKVLHDVFYASAFLPCTCSTERSTRCLSTDHICSLRLDGYIQVTTGDENYHFFDSVIAERNDDSHQLTSVRFYLPRDSKDTRVCIVSPVDQVHEKEEQSAHLASSEVLHDFCQILSKKISCFTFHITKHIRTSQFHYRRDKFYSNTFPPRGPPMALSTALGENRISPKHKVFLAFALSKAFWQYYESDWMKVEWSADTIQLLKTQSFDSNAPLLWVKPADLRCVTFHEHESETTPGQTHLHPYPYIFNLGLLLFQLGSTECTELQISADAKDLSAVDKNNKLLLYCCEKILAKKEWPTLALPAKHKERFRRVVETCFPIDSPYSKILFESPLDVAARRLVLKNHVVRPLLELYQDMADMEETELWPQPSHRVGEPTVLQVGTNRNSTPKTESDLASDWLNSLTTSWLHGHVTGSLMHMEKLGCIQRPKIAVIDTGFDNETVTKHWSDRILQQRLNMLRRPKEEHNWIDFWETKKTPHDIHGHGTAMLSIVHRIAPFADICVARIAEGDDDLKHDPIKTSQNLAKAIRWAVEVQHADIVSLSLGWEDEHCNGEEHIVHNAISNALTKRNQNVLIFAAASNLGGGNIELFPARLPEVISVRALTTEGQNPGFNPSLPKGEVKVFGTLGVKVPVRNLGDSGYTPQDGTSVATAIMAGIAAIIIGYININMENAAKRRSWLNIRTPEGFQRLLHQLSTESQSRQLFMTLKHHWKVEHQPILEAALTSASNPKQM